MNAHIYFIFLFAGSVSLSWIAPTQNEDGTPLTDLAGYKIYWGTEIGTYPNVIDVPDPTATSYEVTDLDPGTYYFVATALNEAGVESRYSGVATKTITTAPSSPTDLVVEGDNFAYGVSQSDDVLELYPVGTVPLGTPCLPDTTVNGKYRVLRETVTFIGSVRPPVVFAECISSGN